MSGADGAAIALEAVAKRYRGGTWALTEITAAIPRGARCALLGPNGSGKTTLVRLIAGAVRPTSGAVRLLGVASDDPAFVLTKRRLGLVPQVTGGYDDLTVGEYLGMVGQLYATERVPEMTARLAVDGLRDRRLGRLSGGQLRRVVIAGALASGPEVLVLDEPLVGLDPVTAREVREILHEAARDQTLVLCTHDLEEAEAMCDSVLVVRHGRVVCHESIARLREDRGGGLFVAAHEGVPALRGALEALGRRTRSLERGVLAVTSTPERDAPALLRALLERGLGVYECRAVQPTLADLMIDVLDGRGLDEEGT